MSSQNLLEDFENLVEQFFSNADEKANFLQKFEKLKATNKRKRLMELEDSENDVSSKKLKLEQNVEMPKLPNEIWLKIMSYLPCKDLFGRFALVNKHFHELSLDPSALKHLQIEDIENELQFKNLMKVVKRSKNLKGISVTVFDNIAIV